MTGLLDLEARDSFALLGPGFSAGRAVLIEQLEPTDDRWPQLFYAAYEDPASGARCFRGEARPLDLEQLPPPEELPIELEATGHAAAVDEIRSAIAAGDVYQVNLTLRAHLPPVSGARLLATMCKRGVPRFAAWIRLPSGEELVSASPELLFEVSRGMIRAEPMKGTAHAGQAEKLGASEKDRAELAMITDLMRNELAQLCRPRSVRVVQERRFIELPYALQTVSDVEGEILCGLSAKEVLSVLHPGGSITGAPKRASMEMIGRLEKSPRRSYCGVLGATSEDRTTASLLIRTAHRTPDGWIYGVGGGVVYDSDAESELEEIRVKLGALGELHGA